MFILPAIDLRDGKVVRLSKGDYDRQTTYSDDPAAVARVFSRAGARWIHVVDLDAAKSGKPIVLIAALATVGVGAVGAGAYFGYRWLKNRKSGDGNVQTDGEKKNVFGFRRNKPEGGKSDAA